MLHSSIEPRLALAEGRASRRIAVLANVGLVQGDRDGFGRVRNVSAEGLCVQTSLPLAIGEPSTVTFHNGAVADCMVRWVTDRHAGLSCNVDPRHMLGAPAPEDRPALPRFYRNLPIELVVQGRACSCVLDSISSCDILATGAPTLIRGQLFSVAIDGLPLIPAVTRISEDGDLHARFAKPIAFAALDAWLVRNFNLSRR